MQGKVYLVGAGPGAADLLTLRAAQLLGRAHIVFYDRLVSQEILDLISPTAERVYVGKEPEMDSRGRQERVHTLLIGHARMGKTVVRLKGGDPFVFGRGGEEMLRLAAAGIEVDIVPGISSSIAAPQSALIPVTHRGMAQSFGVFAGHPGDHQSQGDVNWEVAAGIDTAVFLMGVGRLPVIVERLLSHGRPASTPVAVISEATRREECVYVGTLETIETVAAHAVSPATIIVGEVVNVRTMTLEMAALAETQWEAVS